MIKELEKYRGTYSSFKTEFYISSNKVQISLKTLGIMHITPSEINYEDNALRFKINVQNCNITYKLRFKDNYIDYVFIQYGYVMHGKASKISSEVEFTSEYKKRPIYFDLLSEYKFGNSIYSEIDYQYVLNNKDSFNYFTKYINLEEVTKISLDSQKAIKCLDEISKLLKHRGNSGLPNDKDIVSLFKYSESYDNGINCRGLAMILAELLRCIGLKAYHVTCMPYNIEDSDCHVVTEVYCEDLNKWIMLDPSFNIYVYNDKILNVVEVRKALEIGEELKCYNKINHNGDTYSFDTYQKYMAKNTFRLFRAIISKDGLDHKVENCIYLVSDDYDLDKENNGYKINNPKYFYNK